MRSILWISLSLILLSEVAVAGGPVMPDEWRFPTKAELDTPVRQSQSLRASVAGDFNGDGLVEGANLAIRVGSEEGALLAFVYSSDLKETWFVLDVMPKAELLRMGLSLRPKGKVQTLGPRGYREPKIESELEGDAIDFFQLEGANSLFVWNSKSKTFVRLWESD